jgi:predicted dehydrogenase
MKAIVIGAGSFGRKHGAILQSMPDVSVAAFCSRSIESARSAAEEVASNGSVSSYSDLREALDAEKPDIAVVAVIPAAHGEIEHELISRSIPFLVEKPIGLDPDTPEQIAESVYKAGLITSAAFHMRYLDTIDRLQGELTSRKIVLANAFWMGTLPPKAWWRHAEESGGQLIEQSVHMVDLMRYLLGEVSSVQAVGSSQVIQSIYSDADVPDAEAAVFSLANGATATIVNTCVAPAHLRVGLEVVTPDRFYQFEPGRLSVRGADSSEVTEAAGNPYEAEDLAFVEAVRSGDASAIRSPYDDALRTHRVCMAIKRSSANGTREEL